MTTATLAAACSAYDVSASGVCELSTEWATAAYDAVNPKGRRKSPPSATMHEDRHHGPVQRGKLIGGIRDLRRNSSILDFMVRKHLDYVASHRFQSITGDDDFDDEVERLMGQEFEAENFDERGIYDLDEWIRMAEAMAVLDGDLATLLISGGRVQAIESDRIRDPSGPDYQVSGDQRAEWYNGVRLSLTGRPLAYAVHRRTGGWSALELERIVPRDNCHLHAYCARFDQVRGISPLASAYNQLRDVYEAEEYALVRSKVASIFAAKVMRNAEQSMGVVTNDVDEDGNPKRSTYEVDFGRGPMLLDLDPGDDVQFVESNQPGANLQEFWKFTTLVALKALDLPYGIFDESVGNFFGNKTAWLSYDRACEAKRARLRQLLHAITAHKYRTLIQAKRLSLPKVDGRQLTVADRPWLWVPRKMPWWRPLEEVTASLKAIGGGLTTPQRVCMESDQGDWYENIDDISKAIAYAAKKGITLSFEVSPDLANNVAASRDNVSSERQSK